MSKTDNIGAWGFAGIAIGVVVITHVIIWDMVKYYGQTGSQATDNTNVSQKDNPTTTLTEEKNQDISNSNLDEVGRSELMAYWEDRGKKMKQQQAVGSNTGGTKKRRLISLTKTNKVNQRKGKTNTIKNKQKRIKNKTLVKR